MGSGMGGLWISDALGGPVGVVRGKAFVISAGGPRSKEIFSSPSRNQDSTSTSARQVGSADARRRHRMTKVRGRSAPK